MSWIAGARYARMLDELLAAKVSAAERNLFERLYEEERAAHAVTRQLARADVKALGDELRELRQQKLADERRWADESRAFNEAPPVPKDAEPDAEVEVNPTKAILDRIEEITRGGPDANTLWFEEARETAVDDGAAEATT